MNAVLLADNQDITQLGIRQLCEEAQITEFNRATTKIELVQLLQKVPDSIIILDYTLFDFAGVENLLLVQERFPYAHWILFSDELNENIVQRTIFESHTISIVMKNSLLSEIKDCIRYAINGERFICQHVAALLLTNQRSKEKKTTEALTPTEKEILRSISLGKTTKEIASERISSIHTINTHRKNIFHKIDVNTAHEATKYAFRAGLVDIAEYSI